MKSGVDPPRRSVVPVGTWTYSRRVTRISTIALAKALADYRQLHVENLATYFTNNFTGSHFETLGGRGDAPEVRNQITAADILSVTCLGVNFPAEKTIDLLEGPSGTRLSEHLGHIPTDRDLHSYKSNPIDKGSPAWGAWYEIEGHYVRRTKTSKLLARKRPRLLPILDEVVVHALKLSDNNAWQEVFELLTENEGSVVEELEAIKSRSVHHDTTIAGLSVLRVLDIVVWREHRDDYRRRPRRDSPIFR